MSLKNTLLRINARIQALDELITTALQKDPENGVEYVHVDDIRSRIMVLSQIGKDLGEGEQAEELTRTIAAMPKGKGAPKPATKTAPKKGGWSEERRQRFMATVAAKKTQTNGHAPH
jgi:hypothetical protein